MTASDEPNRNEWCHPHGSIVKQKQASCSHMANTSHPQGLSNHSLPCYLFLLQNTLSSSTSLFTRKKLVVQTETS
jgi:hypothetical protein